MLTRCSKKQVADLKAKQQAIVTNWKALKSKVELRKKLLEKAHKLYQFQALVSTCIFCPFVHGEDCRQRVNHGYTSKLLVQVLQCQLPKQQGCSLLLNTIYDMGKKANPFSY